MAYTRTTDIMRQRCICGRIHRVWFEWTGHFEMARFDRTVCECGNRLEYDANAIEERQDVH